MEDAKHIERGKQTEIMQKDVEKVTLHSGILYFGLPISVSMCVNYFQGHSSPDAKKTFKTTIFVLNTY